jgi:hypothetical protein
MHDIFFSAYKFQIKLLALCHTQRLKLAIISYYAISLVLKMLIFCSRKTRRLYSVSM